MFPFISKRKAKGLGRRNASQISKSLKAVGTAALGAIRQTEKATNAFARTAAGLPAETGRAASGRFVTIDGLRVHVIVRGRGRPVVLIHGNGTMAEDFAICGLIDRLAERYRVIALDRPGFGRTERPRHRLWTASAQAALVHRVLEHLNVERPLVVGHSWGTLVALALAADDRRDLRGLVLLSGYYFPQPRADVTLAKPLAVPGLGDAARALMPAAVSRALVEQSFRQVFRPQPVPARFTARFPAEIAAGSTQLRAVSEDASRLNTEAGRLQSTYGRLALPVVILTGDADAIVDASQQSVRLHAAIAGSTLTMLPGLGHMIHYGARARVEGAIDTMMAPLALGASAIVTPAAALSTKDCSVKYQAAKQAGTLNGQKWNDFRKAECGSAPDAAATSVPNPLAPGTIKTAAPAPAPTPTTTAAKPAPAPAPTAAAGTASFPSAVDPKYAKESAGKARMHTCLDSYNAAKASGTLGGAKWIQKGGGYYSACNTRLKGV